MLISRPHRKLILNLRDPDRVTGVIPSARTLNYKGRNLVVVPHRQDEYRVLRNLGFEPPTPLETYYGWPGRDPFAHQRTTAGFLSTNPRAFCLNGMGCIAGDERVRVSRKGKSYEVDLRTLFRRFHDLPDKGTWAARGLKGDRFGMNRLLDVLYKGHQPTLRFTLADGKTFRCTPDHRIARPDGSWTDAGDLRVGDQLVTNGRQEYACPSCGEVRSLAYPPRHDQVCRACKHAAHSAHMSGAGNPAYKGAPFRDKDGYVRVWAPEHHRADNSGRVYEHILVAEAAFSVQVTRDMHVHHINGVKHDNRPENLEVLTAAEHHRSHDPRVHLDGAVSAKGGLVVVLPKPCEIISIEDGGVTDVYDLCMEAPHHNFVVNGVVVHNSGKTLSVLWAFDYLRSLGLVKRMLVLAPLSTLERAWGDEIFRNFPSMTFAVLHGTREKRHRLLAEDFDVYIINHDGIKSQETCDRLAAREGLDLIVVDELASFRNATTDRWKALNTLVNGSRKHPRREWVWGLTGTPIPNEPTDAWGQVKLINPLRVPSRRGHFRDMVMREVAPYKWVPREGALDIVHEVMQPAIRFAREDCIDLPPTTYATRHAELTSAQRGAFDEMLRRFRTELAGAEVTAANEAIKTNKLLQICCGMAYGPGGEPLSIPAGPRVSVVKEIIEEAEAKVIVFVPYTAALESLQAELSKEYTAAVVHGETSKAERDAIFTQFQNDHNPRVLLANPATLSHGLTLTAANTVVWYAPIHSNEIYQQACARVTRPGQTRSTLIVNIEGTTLERSVYERLQRRERVQGVLLDMVRDT